MTGLDVYLSGLHDDEYSTIYNQLEPSTNNTVPLLSWGLYTEHYHQVLQAAKKKNEMDILEIFTILPFCKVKMNNIKPNPKKNILIESLPLLSRIL